MQLASTARVSKTVTARNKIFNLWLRFCAEHSVQATLEDIPESDRIAYLLVFGMHYREKGQTGKPVRASTVRDALLAVGTGITDMDGQDPRKPKGSDKYHPLLSDFFAAMERHDDPSTRAYPVNLTILRNLPKVLDTEHPTEGQANKHVIDLCILGFFWMLRPSEYLDSSAETRSQAFRLCDMHFTIAGTQHLASALTLNDEKMRQISAATLTFSDQKTGARGEQIGHRATADAVFCPCKALARLVRHLRRHKAPAKTPICTHCGPRKVIGTIPPAFLTNGLRFAALPLQQKTGIDPALVSARSLRPGGATALLCAGVDPNAIQLLGRWRSDAMLRYLRIAAATQTHNFSQRMLDSGSFSFAPGTHTSRATNLLPEQLPGAISHSLSATQRALDLQAPKFPTLFLPPSLCGHG